MWVVNACSRIVGVVNLWLTFLINVGTLYHLFQGQENDPEINRNHRFIG